MYFNPFVPSVRARAPPYIPQPHILLHSERSTDSVCVDIYRMPDLLLVQYFSRYRGEIDIFFHFALLAFYLFFADPMILD